MASISSNKSQNSIVSVRQVLEGGDTPACLSIASNHRGFNGASVWVQRLKANGTSVLSNQCVAYEVLWTPQRKQV